LELLIDNRQSILEINDELINEIENVIKTSLLLEGMSLDVEISLSFVNNEEIKELNKTYRNNDKETDVLSFPIDEDFYDEEQLQMLGDIVISTDMVIVQAEDFGHSVKREVLYLIAHSMFHLMGYDHMTEDDKKIMREKEKNVMKSINVFKKG